MTFNQWANQVPTVRAVRSRGRAPTSAACCNFRNSVAASSFVAPYTTFRLRRPDAESPNETDPTHQPSARRYSDPSPRPRLDRAISHPLLVALPLYLLQHLPIATMIFFREAV